MEYRLGAKTFNDLFSAPSLRIPLRLSPSYQIVQKLIHLRIYTLMRWLEAVKPVDKLLSDRAVALNMAIVCLLVNVGRLNTTLNYEASSPAGRKE